MATLNHYAISRHNGLIVLAGRLDARGCDQIEGTLWRIFEYGSQENFIVDLSNVEYLSSYAVGFLVEACGTVAAFGGQMAISSPQPQVFETLYLNGVDMVIPIYDSYRTALADYQV